MVKFLQQALHEWLTSIPIEYRPTTGASPDSTTTNGSGLYIQLDLHDKYCEAVLAIHRWSLVFFVPESDFESHSDWSTSFQACTDAAKNLLGRGPEVTTRSSCLDWYVPPESLPLGNTTHRSTGRVNEIVLPGLLYFDDRAAIHLRVLSAVIVFQNVVMSKGPKQDLAFLGIACGFFGRQAVGIMGHTLSLFDEINRLSSIAHRLVYEDVTYWRSPSSLLHDSSVESVSFENASFESASDLSPINGVSAPHLRKCDPTESSKQMPDMGENVAGNCFNALRAQDVFSMGDEGECATFGSAPAVWPLEYDVNNGF